MSKDDATFWEEGRTAGVSGDDMRALLLASLESNMYCQPGLALHRAREAERLWHTRAGRRDRAPAPPAVAHLVTGARAKRAETVAHVTELVAGMGLHCSTLPADPPVAEEEGIADSHDNEQVPVLAGPAPETSCPHSAQAASAAPSSSHAPSPRGAATTSHPTGAAAPAAAPKSALAKLVAKAKAQQQESEPLASSSSLATSRPTVSAAAGAAVKTDSGEAPQSTQSTVGGAKKRPREDKDDEESDGDDFAVHLPPGVTPAASRGQQDSHGDSGAAVKHPSQMTREEFLSQFKRAPRRGEIGQSAEEIEKAQQLGYVMSGSRSIGAQMYMDRIQRQLHEREAGKLQQQFRKVEDERMDGQMIQGMLQVLEEKLNAAKKGGASS